MINKDRYKLFCEKVYVPIYSKPWWLNAVCGEENWDVWLYANGNDVLAAMPYYTEERNGYKYITKAPLTQNNGIIFRYNRDIGKISKQIFEEKVIKEATAFLASLDIDVYEQQYQTSFTNVMPFYWSGGYTAIPRYTYIIENTANLGELWGSINGNRRRKVKQGENNTDYYEDMSPREFYELNRKIYSKQSLDVPFSYELWERVYNASIAQNCGKILYRKCKEKDMVASISFIVWDERYVYKLIGGAIPEYSQLEAHSATTWDEIKFASNKGLAYDFEGSVIERIAKSFREFGGIPKTYYRIRKVFNPDIVRKEAEDYIKQNNLE